MRGIVFEGDTWPRYEDLRRRDSRMHRVLRRQLKEMMRGDPSTGTGKLEPLKHNLSGLWSRSLSLKDRLIYKLRDFRIQELNDENTKAGQDSGDCRRSR